MMVRDATLRDAEWIGANQWQRGVEELSAYGITWDEWLKQHAEMIAKGDAIVVALETDEPVAMLAVSRARELSSWFVATDKLDWKATRCLRRAIPREAKRRGIGEVKVYSLCIDSRAPAWFSALGLKGGHATGRTYGGHMERKFEWRA